MRFLYFILLTALLACFTGACASQPAPTPSEAQPEFKPTATIREIMQSMVAPEADVLWGAVSVSVTNKGVEESGPKTDAEWTKVRRDALTLVESSNLLLVPGRRVAPAGAEAQDPKVQLSPGQIEALIDKNRADWTALSHALHDAAMVAVKAIDDRNAGALSMAGDGLNTACENCHMKYWYPNEAKEPKQ